MGFHALGAVGVIAVNPGKYAHWGGGSATWGTADLDDLPYKPAIPAVAVNRADGEALIALAGQGGRAPPRHRVRGRLVPQPAAGGRDPRPPRARALRAAARALRFLGRRRRRQCHRRRRDARDRPRAVAAPRPARAQRAHRLVARAIPPAGSPAAPGMPTNTRSTSRAIAWRISTATVPAAATPPTIILIPWMAENAGFVRGVVRDAAGKDAEGRAAARSPRISRSTISASPGSSRHPRASRRRRSRGAATITSWAMAGTWSGTPTTT